MGAQTTSDGALRVIIAGAGIGGLTAALALLRSGINCEVYEQSPELREVGAGLQLAPNGTRILFALGLEKQIRRYGVETKDKVVRLWSTGQTWSLYDPTSATPAQRYGSPMFLMHRGDLHAMLVDAVRQEKHDAIRLNARCITFEQNQSGVCLFLEDGRKINGDILIGADGIHSLIRRELFEPAEPKFTGIMAWRGLAPIARLPQHLRQPIASQWLGPASHVTCYPVRQGTLLNMVGEVERDDWQFESWVERGTREECRQDFGGWHSDLISIIDSIDTFYKWGLFLRAPLRKWSIGRVSLLGDACHAMLPFLGQGANMAIEDSMILARALQASKDDPVAALAHYEAARVDRTVDVVNRSADMAATFHNDSLLNPETGAEYISAKFDRSVVTDRFQSIYSYDATSAAI